MENLKILDYDEIYIKYYNDLKEKEEDVLLTFDEIDKFL